MSLSQCSLTKDEAVHTALTLVSRRNIINSLKLTAVAAALMLAGSAYAANAEIYGLIDTGLNYQHIDTDVKGTDSVNKMQLRGSQLAPNRFGFRGSEDLGNGMKIAFLLEGQFGSDDGTLTGDRLFNRSSEISIISADYGTLTVGRSGALRSGFGSTGIWGAKTGPWSNSAVEFVAGHKYIMPGGFKAVDNAITFKTPTMSGLTLHAQYSSKMDSTNQKDEREVNPPRPNNWTGLPSVYWKDCLGTDSGQAQKSAFTWNAAPRKPELGCPGCV